MQRYDPAADTVTAMAPMPTGNFAHAVAAQGTKIYVLGGAVDGFGGTTNLIYDTATNTWSSGAAVPTAVQYPAAASDGTYVYLLGGNTTNLNLVQRYDPAANTWTTRATMLTGRGGPAAFFDGTEDLGRRRRLDPVLPEHRGVQPDREHVDGRAGDDDRRAHGPARPSATTWPSRPAAGTGTTPRSPSGSPSVGHRRHHHRRLRHRRRRRLQGRRRLHRLQGRRVGRRTSSSCTRIPARPLSS